LEEKPLQPLEIAAAEAAVIRQMNIFFMALDDRDFDRMASLMTPTAVWRRAGVDLAGPSGLLAEMTKRPDNRYSRHTLTNQVAEIPADGAATLRFYSIAWVHVGETNEQGVAPVSLPSSIGVYTARFVRRDGAWLIDDLRSIPAFRKAK
jgi:hypothetical protein